NARTLKFQYIFEVNDSFEKKLHKLFKVNQTSSINEWFNLNDNNSLDKIKTLNDPLFKDLSLAEFKANQLNNELFRGLKHTQEARKEIFKENYNIKNKSARDLLRKK